MPITTVAELVQWQHKWRRREDSAFLLGVDIINKDQGRYMMDCPIEHLTCSDEHPCNAEDMEFEWDRHLGHIENHCEYRTCPQCYVIDNYAE